MNKFPFFTFYFLLFTLRAFPQTPQLGVNIEDEFKVTAVPDKWKNESAVVIGQKTEYLFTRVVSGKNYTSFVRINEYIHKRIKLQDKNFLHLTMSRWAGTEMQSIRS